MGKKELYQRLEDMKNDGFIDLDDVFTAISNYMSGKEMREFVEFLEEEYGTTYGYE
jgi:hypothetical protein